MDFPPLLARTGVSALGILLSESDVREVGDYKEGFSVLLSVSRAEHSLLDLHGYSVPQNSGGIASRAHEELLLIHQGEIPKKETYLDGR